MSSDDAGGTYEACLASNASSTEALLQCITATYDAKLTATDASLDAFFLLYAASLVFFMQTGFAMIAAGCVKVNNVQNTLLKNLLDACGASLGFYTVGYAFAFAMEKLFPVMPGKAPFLTRSIVHLAEDWPCNTGYAREKLGYNPQKDWRKALDEALDELKAKDYPWPRLAQRTGTDHVG